MKNIREVKKNLRVQCRRYREQMDPEEKARYDDVILHRFLSLREYRHAKMIFTYVSKPIEVDTAALIRAVLASGRKVAAPLCFPETCGMKFYEIRSLEDLTVGSYGVLEPVSSGPPAEISEKDLCIVPGFSFDSHGYRLGYGKGYYDRFLSDFQGIAIGLCYSGCVKAELPHGYYDRPVNILVTDRYIHRIPRKKI